jgi:hypothetical protein
MADIIDTFLREAIKNVGWVDGGHSIIRSGQPESDFKLSVLHKLFPFKSVINLAWAPGTDSDDRDEYRFCLKKKIAYHHFGWGAAVPLTPEYEYFWKEFTTVVELIDKVKKPLWIHCQGGRDRTGGLVAAWKLKHGYPLDEIFTDFCKYGMPANCWLDNLWRKT